jgi:hypothetical protein
VILHQWGPERARPKLISDHLDRLERELSSIDGFFLFLDESTFAVMQQKKLEINAVQKELEPITKVKASRLKYHFSLVYNDRPADLLKIGRRRSPTGRPSRERVAKQA